MGREALAGGHVAFLEVAWNNINVISSITFLYFYIFVCLFSCE